MADTLRDSNGCTMEVEDEHFILISRNGKQKYRLAIWPDSLLVTAVNAGEQVVATRYTPTGTILTLVEKREDYARA